MSNLFRGFFAVFVLTCFSSCLKKVLPAGIGTTVNGNVFDPVRQQPVTGAKIVIQEFVSNSLFSRPKFIGDVDSATTGLDGNFSIRFNTTGKGSSYKVVMNDERFSNYFSARVRVGVDTTIRVENVRYSWMRAELSVMNNSRPPLRVLAPYGSSEVWASTTDTVYYTRVFPNQPAYFEFAVGADQYGNVTHSQRDTVMLTGFNDTFYHNFRLTPDQFKPR